MTALGHFGNLKTIIQLIHRSEVTPPLRLLLLRRLRLLLLLLQRLNVMDTTRLLLLLRRRLNVMDTTDSSITDAMLLDWRPMGVLDQGTNGWVCVVRPNDRRLLLLLLLQRLNVIDTTDPSITDAMLLNRRPMGVIDQGTNAWVCVVLPNDRRLLLLLLLRRLNVMDTTDSSITDAMLLDRCPTVVVLLLLDRRSQQDLVDGRMQQIRDATFCKFAFHSCLPFLHAHVVKGKHRRRRGFHWDHERGAHLDEGHTGSRAGRRQHVWWQMPECRRFRSSVRHGYIMDTT